MWWRVSRRGRSICEGWRWCGNAGVDIQALVGVMIGLVTALLSARWLESLLFEIQARDPIVFAAVSVVMLGVALLASYLPARRASAVDPVEAIRME